MMQTWPTWLIFGWLNSLFRMKVGILDEEERQALEGKQYAPNKFFTPEKYLK